MKLSDHDLLQLTEKELLELPEDIVRRLSIKLLVDLKDARERLKQTSRNSSRPPSSDKPWDNADSDKEKNSRQQDQQSSSQEEPSDSGENLKPNKREVVKNDDSSSPLPDKRKAGKQPGATGYGRQQVLSITAEELHYPTVCARCDNTLNSSSVLAHTAFETVDLQWADAKQPGLRLTNTKHTYFEILCACGHCTQKMPYRQVSHTLTPDITLCEWRLVGPGLAALIVCLAYRMRLSRVRIQEFLQDWLGLAISVGTLQATLHESGAAVLPVEDELVVAIQNSGLLHIDETSWPELNENLWLWVFVSQGVVAYWIANRGSELLSNVLENTFLGWLMSDGWGVYRQYRQRLRCWAHLIRKATSLNESLDLDARQFGAHTLKLLNTLMEAIYTARKSPPDQALIVTYQKVLTDYRCRCETLRTSTHKKTRELAREMLNDWDAIFQVLTHPHLPLTNNEAERALRHWVILRNICHGTRTEDGTRIFAILISVIETCRVRQQSPWIYLAAVIGQRRAGFPAPKLPVDLTLGV